MEFTDHVQYVYRKQVTLYLVSQNVVSPTAKIVKVIIIKCARVYAQ